MTDEKTSEDREHSSPKVFDIHHPYLTDFEKHQAEALEAKIAIAKQKRELNRKTYVRPLGCLDRDRVRNREKYHRKKQLTHCEVCDKSVYYIVKHQMTKAHMSKLNNPLDVVKEIFPDIIEPLTKEVEELKITKEKLDDRLDAMIVKPIEIQSKKSRYGKPTKVSFV